MTRNICFAFLARLGIFLAFVNTQFITWAKAEPLFVIKSILTRKTEGKPRQDNLKPAVFPGGKEALHQFLENTILLPESAFQQASQSDWIGTSATLFFQITEQGQATLNAAKTFKSLEVIPDQAEVRTAAQKIYTSAVAKMPLWQPAFKNGKPVSFSDSVVFSIGIAPTSYAEYSQSKKVSLSKPNISVSSANLKTKAGSVVYAFMEKPPTFPGGLNGLIDYLEQHSNFTTGPVNNSFNESVIVQVIINETGLVENALVAKSLGAKADAEAVKVLKALPKWNPAKQGNKFIASVISLFLRYK